MSSPERFGFEWNRYREIEDNYELQFRRWIMPLTERDFAGKKVLDAGCGMGRNSVWSLEWGAAELVAFDFDERSVSVAKQNLSRFPNARVLFRNIYEITWENEFDLVFSIGVIHHLEDPDRAVKNLVRAAKPNGRVLLWVYSFEGNEWIVRFVNPIRKLFTSRLSLPLVHAMGYLVSVPLWLLVKRFHGPSRYLAQLSKFSFRHIHSIVFDQLIPRVANYWTRDQALSLFHSSDIKDAYVYRPANQMGWTVIGRKRI